MGNSEKWLKDVSIINALASLPDDVQLTTSEAAIFLRVSVSSLERWRKDGNGPAYVQIAKSGARSLNQKCGYLKGDLIGFQNKHRVSSSTESWKMRSLAFMPFRDPSPKRSDSDLTTKRPFYIDAKNQLICSVEETILQDVIERLGRVEIEWVNPILAAYMTWSTTLAHAQYSTGIKKTLNFALQQIDAAVEEQKNAGRY